MVDRGEGGQKLKGKIKKLRAAATEGARKKRKEQMHGEAEKWSESGGRNVWPEPGVVSFPALP